MNIFKITSSFVFAISLAVTPSFAKNTTTTNNGHGGAGSTTYVGQNAPSSSGGGGGGGGANSAGNNNGMQALISVGANVAMGAAMMTAFKGSCTPTAASCIWPLLAMGLLSYAQSSASGQAGGDSFNAADQVNFCPECFTGKPTDFGNYNDGAGGGIWDLDPTTTIPTGPYGTVGELQTAMKGLAGKVKDSGYKVDMANQKLISPDGEETSFSAVNDMVGNGTGLSDTEMAAVKNALKKAEAINSTYKVAAMGLDNSGGGGGAGSYKFAGIDTDNDFADYLKKLRGKGNRKPASIAGMKRVVNGESIGVAGDNIFDMVHRRYQKKRKTNNFNEVLAPVRAKKPRNL